jgi:transcription-repair coupling factor (superfamily II helicase)
MEHWLPLFEDRLATLFDHLGDDDLVVIDSTAVARARSGWPTSRTITASGARPPGRPRAAIARSSRERCTCRARSSPPRSSSARCTAPTSSPSPRASGSPTSAFRSARDFAPERSRGDNVYEAAAAHFKLLGHGGKRPLFAAYSEGSRSRIASIPRRRPGPR